MPAEAGTNRLVLGSWTTSSAAIIAGAAAAAAAWRGLAKVPQLRGVPSVAVVAAASQPEPWPVGPAEMQ